MAARCSRALEVDGVASYNWRRKVVPETDDIWEELELVRLSPCEWYQETVAVSFQHCYCN